MATKAYPVDPRTIKSLSHLLQLSLDDMTKLKRKGISMYMSSWCRLDEQDGTICSVCLGGAVLLSSFIVTKDKLADFAVSKDAAYIAITLDRVRSGAWFVAGEYFRSFSQHIFGVDVIYTGETIQELQSRCGVSFKGTLTQKDYKALRANIRLAISILQKHGY